MFLRLSSVAAICTTAARTGPTGNTLAPPSDVSATIDVPLLVLRQAAPSGAPGDPDDAAAESTSERLNIRFPVMTVDDRDDFDGRDDID